MKTVVGIFHDPSEAAHAFEDLHDRGLHRRQIRILGEAGRGFGPSMVEGLTGASRQQRIRALLSAGVPVERAGDYADEVAQGRTVLAVRCEDHQVRRVHDILARAMGGAEVCPEPPPHRPQVGFP